MINTAPKFKKITLVIKKEDNYDKYFKSTQIVEHEDCGMVITGDYVIITEDFNGDVIDEEHSVKGKIYKLKDIDSYKLYKN